jgi:malonate transporter
MQALADVILPVFVLIGFGYAAVRLGWFSDEATEGLMRFSQDFAFPCLLFLAMARLDLGQDFQPPLLGAFYLGAFAGFAIGLLGARLLFARPWADSVAIGFSGMFSNSLLLGVPITERAFGPQALDANFAIIAIHAPTCYLVGIAAMEVVRNRGGAPLDMLRGILRTVLSNGLVIGILAGLAVNLSGLPLPGVLTDAMDLFTRAALPAALFGLGGVLCRYRPEGDLRTIFFICAISLVIHPAITFGLGHLFGLSTGQLRSAVITAAMAPGVNTYVFASMYGVAKRVAASSVLFATAGSMLTVWGWLTLLS